MSEPPGPLPGFRVDPFGKEFPWGPIQQVYRFGEYVIAEYLRDTSGFRQPYMWEQHGQPRFHVWVNGTDTHAAYPSLDHALIGALAYKYEKMHTSAPVYIARMLGVDD